MMADGRSRFRGEEIATRCLEKRQDCVVLPRGRIRDIDSCPSAGERLRQATGSGPVFAYFAVKTVKRA